MKPYPPQQFALFRLGFGIYLAFLFIQCIPFAEALFSLDGMLPLNFSMPFPSFLYLVKGNSTIQGFLVLFALLSILYALGIQRRICAVLLWYGYASLVNRLPTVTVPSQGYIGWFLLASALIPSGESFTKADRQEDWAMPTPILVGAWLILALGYTFSGIDKLDSPSWKDGNALRFIFESPVVTEGWIKRLFLSLPPFGLKIMTWFSLWLEVLYAPLCIFGFTRKWSWVAMVLIHLIVLFAFDIRAVSIAFLLTHLFVFDHRWLPRRFSRNLFDPGNEKLRFS